MEILNLERVGVHDRFLDLGGDSLQATRILDRTNESLKVEMKISDLFHTETIAQMADLIALPKTST